MYIASSHANGTVLNNAADSFFFLFNTDVVGRTMQEFSGYQQVKVV